jgi:hypothetical protein
LDTDTKSFLGDFREFVHVSWDVQEALVASGPLVDGCSGAGGAGGRVGGSEGVAGCVRLCVCVCLCVVCVSLCESVCVCVSASVSVSVWMSEAVCVCVWMHHLRMCMHAGTAYTSSLRPHALVA